MKSSDGVYFVQDSYKWRKYNVYGIKYLYDLIDNGIIYPEWYLFLPEAVKSKEELKRLKDMELLIKQNIENNSTMWHNTNSEQYKERLHECNNVYKSKLEDIQTELQKF